MSDASNKNETASGSQNVTSVIGKIDTVIEKITKSKKFASVRILEEVRHEILQNGVSVSTDQAVARPVTVPKAKVEHNGAEPYIAQNGEIDDLIAYIGAGENVLLTGATGCGKTHLVEHVARMLGKTLGTIQGEEGMRKEDIIGYRHDLGADSYTYGVLPRTMQAENGMLYWDEPNATPAGIQFVCFRAMDTRRSIILPDSKGGEEIKAKAGFVVVAAMNEGRAYRGTSALNTAMRGRFGAIIDLDYLPEARERKLLVDRTGIDKDIAEKLCHAARQLRASCQRGEITTPISTRSLIACCNGVQHGLPIMRTITLSIINQIEGTKAQERKAVSDVMEAHFGKGAK